ncbi:MAG: hypothetical protein JXB00_14840, partial [Bacteroidales bacterium]|nr:hypothetical protein [Bacteroidales bacterium]
NLNLMKRTILFICMCGTIICLHAQSKKTIFLNDGKQIEYSKVKGKKTNVLYKTPEGVKNTLDYDDVHFIIKRREVFVPDESFNIKYLKPGPLTMNLYDINKNGNCTKGMLEAIGNTDFTGARIGGLATGLLFPIGFVGTAIIASTPPDNQKMIPPDKELVNDKIYIECYQKTVKKQKRKQTWSGASYGALAVSMIVLAVVGGTY